jgi:hypothetical protein
MSVRSFRTGRYFGPLSDKNAFIRTGFASAGPSLQIGAAHGACSTASIRAGFRIIGNAGYRE